MYGGIKSADLAWALGDVGVGAMAWLNIVAILILQRPALLALKDYEAQLKEGLDPVFDAEAVGIENADFWVKNKAE
jgi:AGCS family alanine or glycine:cation symporter